MRNVLVWPIAIGATAILAVGLATSLSAAEDTQSGASNTRSVPITVFMEGPSNYPPDAVGKGEEGTTVLAIVESDGYPKAKPLQSSGFADLDAAANAIALESYRSHAMTGTQFFAIVWSLKANKTSPPAPAPNP